MHPVSLPSHYPLHNRLRSRLGNHIFRALLPRKVEYNPGAFLGVRLHRQCPAEFAGARRHADKPLSISLCIFPTEACTVVPHGQADTVLRLTKRKVNSCRPGMAKTVAERLLGQIAYLYALHL